MTATPPVPPARFRLELTLGDQPCAALSEVIDGQSTPAAHVALAQRPPYALGVALHPSGPPGSFTPELRALSELPARPFDPALVGDDGVLAIDWQLRDHQVDTQDDTAMRISLHNRSSYYEADDLELRVRAIVGDGSPLGVRPDGNALISVWPEVQSTRSIGPGRTISFDYLVVTRGPRAGRYALEVEVDYKLVYVYRELCRQTVALARLPLRIHGGHVAPLDGHASEPAALAAIAELTAEAVGPLTRRKPPIDQVISVSEAGRMSRPQRRLHMPEQVDTHADNESAHHHSRGRTLHPIERKVMLPGGGELAISYRLVKGSHTKPDDSRACYGYNPHTKEIESYFSTSDEAAMEITLRNCSDLHLKHVRLTDVHLFHAKDNGDVGHPADDDRLPDGNHLFEVLPNEVYFGQLEGGESRVKYLGLVTRGVHSGRFLVRVEVKYEIVDGSACAALPLVVNPD